ncbi:hypothetical protein CORC01_07337 [Colletotrichum orchidophilum]|uniref:Uncharacterized protein n=1 Tax=Colletotrichum orchidophilum TaxID=1209926 RepID=A0A1G4B7M6_9PEZI|nr:uncharacterized protein CORC01_07337 [Colletotrichum orchidophilum]OHE97282.1 hypothetical protein CORC01_07337 [Colletotrichum orchidophilum]
MGTRGLVKQVSVSEQPTEPRSRSPGVIDYRVSGEEEFSRASLLVTRALVPHSTLRRALPAVRLPSLLAPERHPSPRALRHIPLHRREATAAAAAAFPDDDPPGAKPPPAPS